MSFEHDDYLTAGVMFGRCVAFAIDAFVIALLWVLMAWVLGMFGILTLGLGFGLWPLLAWLPFCYHLFSILGSNHATPGQRAMGLTVRRNDDLGPPTLAQAAVSTVLFYVSLGFSGVPFLLALFTIRHRTLHDMLGGLVLVRRKALWAPSGAPGR
jgi:uncharacterized RDD family membrane protein YckC